MILLVAFAFIAGIDRQFQTYILNTFPKYGAGLTNFEDNRLIRNQLQKNDGTDLTFDTILPKGPMAPEIILGGVWFNTDPLILSELKGKVVIIDFWTYTCINCQRTFPYLKSWNEKYKDKGLVIIGVHAPEFEFEKNAKNLSQAISDFGLTYPIVQDNNFSTWRAYNNRYWPAKYIIDKDWIHSLHTLW